MRSEEEVRSLYAQYLYRHAAIKDDPEQQDISNQLLGAAFAYGRMCGLGMTRIRLDVKRAYTKLEQNQKVKNSLLKAL